MSKINRNAPCPCGSGKKYKKCCAVKGDEPLSPFATWQDEPTAMELAGTPNLATQTLRNFRQAAGDTVFESEEALEAALEAFQNDSNETSLLDFLGLTPNQMYRISEQPLSALSDMMELCFPANISSYMDAPVVRIALSILIQIRTAGGLKMTSKGNLPLAVVKHIYAEAPQMFDLLTPTVRSEESLPELFIVRNLLELADVTVITNGRLQLTRLGVELMDTAIVEKNAARLYRHLFLEYANRFNWLVFSPLADDFALVQQTVLFNLYILHKKAQHWVGGASLAIFFTRAFPAFAEQLKRDGEVPAGETPDEAAGNGFLSLFIYQFCWMFALLDQRESKSGDDDEFVVSNLFRKICQWKI